MRCFAILAALLLAHTNVGTTGAAPRVSSSKPAPRAVKPVAALARVIAPPATLVRTWGLSATYTKYIAVHGFPILGSARVSDAALREAAYLVEQMLGQRTDVLDKLAANHVRFVVMAPTEMTTDVPEHSDLEPKDFWDRRARGLGATSARPAVSCGEENLLNLDGDPYSTENILVHELSHAIHQMAMVELDPTFETRLVAAFEAAKKAKRWANTYAMDSYMEYWAEGAQSWFDTNRTNDDQHGPIGTRAQLVTYDPPLAALLTEVFGDRPWRYRKIAARDRAGVAHLAGWDRRTAGTFRWPARVANTPIDRLPDTSGPGGSTGTSAAPTPTTSTTTLVATAAATSPGSAATTSVVFANRRAQEVIVEWIDFAGAAKRYATLAPGEQYTQQTYVGHVWRVLEDRRVLGYATATTGSMIVEIR